jgi:hypothetical protein
MGWAEIRKKARRVTHSTFALPAVYTSPAGVETPCMARKHNSMKTFGDLDREGFAVNIEDVNQVVFDKLEVEPERKGTVDFGAGQGKFNIVNILPDSTDDFRRVEVTLA